MMLRRNTSTCSCASARACTRRAELETSVVVLFLIYPSSRFILLKAVSARASLVRAWTCELVSPCQCFVYCFFFPPPCNGWSLGLTLADSLSGGLILAVVVVLYPTACVCNMILAMPGPARLTVTRVRNMSSINLPLVSRCFLGQKIADITDMTDSVTRWVTWSMPVGYVSERVSGMGDRWVNTSRAAEWSMSRLSNWVTELNGCLDE